MIHPVVRRLQLASFVLGVVIAIGLVAAAARPPAPGPTRPAPSLTVSVAATAELEIDQVGAILAVLAAEVPRRHHLDVRNLTSTRVRLHPEVVFQPPEGGADWLVDLGPGPLVVDPGDTLRLPLTVGRSAASGAPSHLVDVAATLHLVTEAAS